MTPRDEAIERPIDGSPVRNVTVRRGEAYLDRSPVVEMSFENGNLATVCVVPLGLVRALAADLLATLGEEG